MDSRPIPTALSYDSPNLTNSMPQELKEMVLLRFKKMLKEKQKLEK